MKNAKRPYRGMRGDFVVESLDRGVWYVLVGANTEEAARREARKYRGHTTRITPNKPGDPIREGSYKP